MTLTLTSPEAREAAQHYGSAVPSHDHIAHFGVSSGGSTAATHAIDPKAWHSFVCGYCGEHTNGAVLARFNSADTGKPMWLRCTSCGEPTVIDAAGQQRPGPRPGPDVEGLPGDVAAAYSQARDCYSIGGYTGCELVCRKILMHVAADKGAAEGETFKHYLDHLEASGYITAGMKGWLDRIRTHANESTHSLPEPTAERAESTLEFTAQLLRIVYEMPAKAERFAPPPPEEP